jgi:hypothetical protein
LGGSGGSKGSMTIHSSSGTNCFTIKSKIQRRFPCHGLQGTLSLGGLPR